MFQREFLQFGQTLNIKYLMQKRSNSEILGNSLVPYSNYDLPELLLNKELCSFKAITRSLKKNHTTTTKKRKYNTQSKSSNASKLLNGTSAESDFCGVYA